MKDHININHWIDRSRSKLLLNELNNDVYVKAWGSIIKYFENLDKIDWDNFVVGIHIAYGWMPTIPKLEKTYGLDSIERDSLLISINKLRDFGVILAEDDLNLIKQACNNSIVGASKLLHFLRPDLCPIWDSRVAQVFFWPGYSKVNNIESYLRYRNEMSRWVKNEDLLIRVNEIKSAVPSIASAPPMRVIELVMFVNV